MSAPSSPTASSGSDDFAAMLDEELQFSLEEIEDAVKDDEAEDDDGENEVEEIRGDGAGELGVNLEEASPEGAGEEDGEGEGEGEDEEVDVEEGDGEGEELNSPVTRNAEYSRDTTLVTEEYKVSEELEGRKRKREEEEDDKRDLKSVKGECPPHPGFMWGVCIRCGENRQTSNSEPAEVGVALRYIHEGLEVTEREAARMRRDELKHVIARKKLYLVLDLDHTLLNSARFIEVPPEEEAYLTSCYSKDRPVDMPSGSNHETKGSQPREGNSGYKNGLNRLTHLQMWTKIRPFAHEFLEAASKMFEMYVYTMGERTYALAMARLLDPTGRFFGDRVISQGDSTRRTTKDLDVVLGAESAVVILDDTEGVWPKHRANLILMERYHFFRSSCRQFGLKSLSLSEKKKDESDERGTLATALSTLRGLHHAVFSTESLVEQVSSRGDCTDVQDVRKVLQTMRRRTLQGCRVVFSRIFPTGMPYPETHPFWRLTEELGAHCSNTLHQTATHIVGLDLGTDKARWAKQHGKFVVHPSWVEAAQYLWLRPREADFPVGESFSDPPRVSFTETVDIVEESRAEARENGIIQTSQTESSHGGESRVTDVTNEIKVFKKKEETPVLDSTKPCPLLDPPQAIA